MSIFRKSEEIAGFLDEGTNVTGDLQFSHTLRIDGNFHGSIASEDMLIVGEQAVVHADIKVGDLEVHGQVFGNVEVQRRTEIFSTGRLSGDLQTSVLLIQAGAVLDARSHMHPDPVTPANSPLMQPETSCEGDPQKPEIKATNSQ
jgi:cytoskeletal protein CcmA (bactofilin family)